MSPLKNVFGDDLALAEKQDQIIAALAATLRSRLVDANGVAYDELRPLPVDVGGNIQIDNLTVEFESVISTLNSTSVPLGADEVFVGEWEDVLSYAGVVAAIFTDAPSAQDGAAIEFSADAVDVITRRTATMPANFGGYFSIPIEARYFRIRYTNGPQPQTVLEAQVGYQFNPPANPQAPMGALQTDASVAVITKSAVQGRHPFGYYVPLQVDEAGQLRVIGPATAAEIGALGLATEAGQAAVQSSLADLLAELQAKLNAGGTVALDAPTLAALEQVTATVANWPSDFPDTGAHATLATIVAKLNDIFGAVDGLEISAGNIDISNTTIGLALDEVESLLRQVRDRADFPLPAGQVAALTPPSTVSVSNFPASTEIANDVGNPVPVSYDALLHGLSNYETRFEYDASDRPTRIGLAPTGTATSATTWTIRTFDYGARTDGNPVRISVSTGAWS